VLEESADFATRDPEKLSSKLKSRELSRKDRPNHDASHFTKALISNAHVGGHDANPTNTTDSSALEFALSSHDRNTLFALEESESPRMTYTYESQ
jgi:hypothetical protein